MNRNKFLKELGFRGAALMALYCAGACTYSHSDIHPTYPIDFTIDLSSKANSELKLIGGYLVTNNVVVAHVTATSFVAATLICSHEGQLEITFDYSRNIFSCNAHGAAFDLTGKGLNERGKNGLKIYQTTLSGTALRVFG